MHFQEEALAAEPTRYAAFISYRHMPRDRQWAIRIMRELETYRTPKPLHRQAIMEELCREMGKSHHIRPPLTAG